MAIAAPAQIADRDDSGHAGGGVPQGGWLYTATNALFLLYLLWAIPLIVARIVERRYGVAIPLAIALLYAGQRLIARAPRLRIIPLSLIAFAVYVLWGVVAQVTPSSDFLSFYRESVDYATRHALGIPLTTKSPTTILWYGAAFRVFGASSIAMYVSAALLWAVQIPLLYAALASMGLRDATAKTAALLYGFSPSVVFYAPLITSESLFNCLMLVCLFLSSQRARYGQVWRGAALGAVVALLFITRMNGLALLIALLLVERSDDAAHGVWRRRTVLLGAFCTVVLLNAVATWCYTGRFSLAPSRWSAYNVMTGTNRDSHGGYSRDDHVLAGFEGPSTVSHEEASRKAWRIAGERIAQDPLGFVAFAFTDKLAVLWESDIDSVGWSTNRSPHRPALDRAGIIPIAHRLTDAFWLFLNLSAAFALLWCLPWLRRRGAPLSDQLTYLMVLPMLLWSLMHVFVEVQQRYHVPYYPFLSALAAMGLQVLRDRTWLGSEAA